MGRDELITNMLSVMPVIFKRLMRSLPPLEVPKQQFDMLFHINCHNGKPMSFYSDKMMVSKPNLTVLADKLIEEGLVERQFDPNDRRLINLKITEKGDEFLHKHRERVRKEMYKKLESLDDADIRRLNELIGEMVSILEKIE